MKEIESIEGLELIELGEVSVETKGTPSANRENGVTCPTSDVGPLSC